MPLLSLPNELVLLAAEHLGPKDLFALICTNRALADLLTPRLHDLGAQETYTTSHTALYWAAHHGHAALVRTLLSRGAAVAEIAVPDHSTALHWAAKSGDEETTELLLRAEYLNTPDRVGEGPIFWAARAGHENIVRLLAKRGALLENMRGQLLLHEAIAAGQPGIARVLLENGADCNRYDQFGWLPLHYAARRGDEATTERLLDLQAGVNARHLGSGATALHWAAEGGHEGVIRLLVGRSAEVEAKDERCAATPFHWAAYCGKMGAAECLLVNGADINALCGGGNTALHLALHDNDASHDAVVKLLLERTSGPDLNAQNDAGDTPLRWPVFNGFHNSVERMLRGGADIFVRDDQGRTVLNCAEERLDREMFRTLVRYGTKGILQASSVKLKSFLRVVPKPHTTTWRERRASGASHLPCRPWLFIPLNSRGTKKTWTT